MSSARAGDWPSREPGIQGFGWSMLGNLGVGAIFFAVGVLVHGYGGLDGLTGHPALLLGAIGVALAGSVVAGLALLTGPGTRRFGAGVVGGALFAALVELVGLVAYFVQVVGD